MIDTEVILLGATGQLGSEWHDVLLKKQIKVHAFSSKELDISDFEQVKTVIRNEKPKLVINCAAYTKVDLAESEWNKTLIVNAKSVSVLAQVCKEIKAKLVHYSTDYVFSGSEGDVERFPNGYTEEQFPAPQSNYGISKYLGELYIREQLTDYLIIRVAWLCGKKGSNFIKTMIKLGKERSELNVVNDQFGSPSFTDNVVTNTIALLNADAKGTFHITSTGMTNWYEFAKTAIELKELKTKMIPIKSSEWPSPVKRPVYSKLNTSKLAMFEGVSIEHWSVGLKRLIESL